MGKSVADQSEKYPVTFGATCSRLAVKNVRDAAGMIVIL